MVLIPKSELIKYVESNNRYFSKHIFILQVILSACSPYFQSILSHLNSPNPVVVMPHDVQYEEVVRLVDFMYYGEVAIPRQDINR